MYNILHVAFGYFFLLFTVRFLSRRPGAQMTPFEFVIVFLIGGVIILSSVDNDHSETNSVIEVMTVALVHRLVSALAVRFRKFGAVVEGIPLVLIDRGDRRVEIMRRMRIQDPDIMAAGRTKGARTFDDIRYAILERLGSISIIKKGDK